MKESSSHQTQQHFPQGSGKSSRVCKHRIIPLLQGLVLGLLSGAPLTQTMAEPQGGHVVAGSGQIQTTTPNTTQINQQSQNLVIDWQSFNINTNEVVRFNQPNAQAAALNRIFDQNPTQIFGRLEANGQVMLMNPNGVFFQPGSHVNVGSLIASGLNIRSEDFINGNFNFEGIDGTDGLVVNHGLIEAATGGQVTLLGKAVQNNGVIVANAGQVNLVAGKKVTMDFDGDGLLQFAVAESVLENAQSLDSAVDNSGNISAEGGVILLTANAAKDIFNDTINNSGVIKAGKIENKGGVIRLVGMGAGSSVLNTGTVDVSSTTQNTSGGEINIAAENINQAGTLTADSAQGDGGQIKLVASDTNLLTGNSSTRARSLSNGAGGDVHILGDKVGLLDSALVDATGEQGGGEILVGGDYQGNNADILNANRTVIASDVQILANAVDAGDGGKIIIWSDQLTAFYGHTSATGGEQTGNGGFIELSSALSLDKGGTIDLTADNGNVGTLLLDPLNIEIQGGTGDGSDDTDGNANQLIHDSGSSVAGSILFADEGSGTPDPFIITEQEIEDQSASADIILEARNSIVVSGTFNNDADGGGADDPGTNTVLIQGGNSLTLRTKNDGGDGIGGIDLTAGGTLNALDFKTIGGGSITIQTGNDGIGGGGGDAGNAPITVGVLTSSGNVTIESEGLLTVNGSISGGILSLTSANDSITTNASLLATSGGITLDANGTSSDLNINASLTSGSGNILLTADNDILLAAAGNITSTSGNVSLTADSNDGGATSGALTMADDSVIDAGSGEITLAADEDITLGGLLTTNATGSAVSITSTEGAVVDGGNTDTDIVANNTSAVVTINAVTGVGDGAAIEINVDILNVTNSTSGNIEFLESNGLTVTNATQTTDNDAADISITSTTGDINVGVITTGGTAGDVTLNSIAGAVTESGADGGVDITADVLTIDAVNGVGAAGAIETAVSTFNVDNSGAGNIDIDNNLGTAVSITSMTTVGANIDFDQAGGGDLSIDGSVTSGDHSGTDGGNITIISTGNFSVNERADSHGGSGGVATLTGVVVASGKAPHVGAGNITLTSTTTLDTIIQADITNTTSDIVLNAIRDVIIEALVSTTGLFDITLNADSDLDGSGGVWVKAAGEINSGQDVFITGAKLVAGGTGESVLVDSDGVSNQITAARDLSISHNSAAGLTNEVIAINGLLDSTGTLQITSTGNLLFGTNGSMDSNDGAITLIADDEAGNNGAVLSMSDGTLFDAGAGAISLTADGSITVGGLLTTNATNTAVSLTSTSGAIVDGGDTDEDIDAVNGRFVASAGTTVGTTAAHLETTIDSLDATASAGGVFIDELDGLDVFSATAAGAGNDVEITSASGDIQVATITAADNVVIDATTGSIVDDNSAVTKITSDKLTLTAKTNVGAITDFAAATGDALELDITSNFTLISIDDAGGNINIDIGTSAASFGASSIVVDTDGAASAILQTSGNLNASTAPNAFDSSAGDSIGLISGGTLTIPDPGMNFAGSNLLLSATTDIVDVSATRSYILQANSLTFISGSGGGNTTLTTTVGTLSTNIGANNIVVNETDNLILNSVVGVANVTVNAGGSITSATDDGVADVSGTNVVLNAAAGGIGVTGTHVDVSASSSLSADTVTGDDGDIFIDGIGDLTVNLVDAGTGDVEIETTGAIRSAVDDGVADVVGATVVLNAAVGGIGVTGTHLDVAAATSLNADTVTGDDSDIFIDSIGNLAVDLIDAGTGDVEINSTAAIRSLADDGVADVAGATVILNAAVGGIGVTGTHLDVAAATSLNADTVTGDDANIFIDGIGDLALGLLDAGLGDIDLSSTQAINDANGGTDNIRSNNLDLNADTGIGAGDALEVQVTSLNSADVISSGGLALTDSTGGTLSIAAANVLGDIALIADEINFTGGADSIVGDSALTLAPTTINTTIDIGSPTGGTGTLDISDADLQALADGFSSMAIGIATTGAHAITVGSLNGISEITDPLTIHAPAGAGLITITDDITTSDNGAVIFDGATTFGGVINISITSANGLTFNNDVVIGSAGVSFTAMAGDILFSGFVDSEAPATVNEHNPLSLIASGDVTFAKKVGSSQNGGNANTGTLGQLRINATNVNFNDTLQVGGLDVSASGTMSIAANITTTGMTNVGGLTLTGVDLGNATGGISLTNNVVINSSVNNLAVNLTGSTISGGTNDLEFNAGNLATVTTTQMDNLGNLTLTDANAFIFNGAITATTLTTAAQPYSIAFNGGGTITADTDFISTGALTLGNDAADTLTFTNGLDTTMAPSTVSIAGTVATTNSQMDLGNATGLVTLSDDATIDTGNGTLNAGVITGGVNALVVTAGAMNANGNVTANTGISITAPITLSNGSTTFFTTTTGNLTLGAIDGTDNTDGVIEILNLNSGSGDLTMAAIGSAGAETLETVILSAADDAVFNGAVNLANILAISTISTSVIFNNTLNISRYINTGGSYQLSLLGDTTISSTNGLAFDNTGGVVLGNGGGDTFVFNGGLDSFKGTTTINGAVSTSTSKTLNFADLNVTGTSSLTNDTSVIQATSISGAGQQLTVTSNGAFQVLTGTVNSGTLNTSGTGFVKLLGGGQIDNSSFTHTGLMQLSGGAGGFTFTNGLDTTAGPSAVTLGGTISTGANTMTLGADTIASATILSSDDLSLTGDLTSAGSQNLSLMQDSGNISIAGGAGFLSMTELDHLLNGFNIITIGNGAGSLAVDGDYVFRDSVLLDAATITFSANRVLTGAGVGTGLGLNGDVNGGANNLTLINPGALGLGGDITAANITFNSNNLAITSDSILRSSTDVINFNTSVLGGGNLDIKPSSAATDYSIDGTAGAGHIKANAFTGFSGHLIIGAELTPLDSPASDAAVVGNIANSITVGAQFPSGGAITLIAKTINLNESMSAGGPGGEELTLIAADGDITASNAIDIAAGSGFIVASGNFVNSSNVDLLFDGGELTLALGDGEQDQTFGISSNVSSVENPDLVNVNLLQSLSLTNLQAVQVTIINPASQLSGLDAVQFIDTSLFESELSLFGVIGSGLAMDLSQCEDVEGCAPNITEEELISLIDGIKARIETLEILIANGEIDPEVGASLLDGFKGELENFEGYLIQLQKYLVDQAEGDEGFDDEEFADEDIDEETPVDDDQETDDEELVDEVTDEEFGEGVVQEESIGEETEQAEVIDDTSGTDQSSEEETVAEEDIAEEAIDEEIEEDTFDDDFDDSDFEEDVLTDAELEAIEMEESDGDAELTDSSEATQDNEESVEDEPFNSEDYDEDEFDEDSFEDDSDDFSDEDLDTMEEDDIQFIE